MYRQVRGRTSLRKQLDTSYVCTFFLKMTNATTGSSLNQPRADTENTEKTILARVILVLRKFLVSWAKSRSWCSIISYLTYSLVGVDRFTFWLEASIDSPCCFWFCGLATSLAKEMAKATSSYFLDLELLSCFHPHNSTHIFLSIKQMDQWWAQRLEEWNITALGAASFGADALKASKQAQASELSSYVAHPVVTQILIDKGNRIRDTHI